MADRQPPKLDADERSTLLALLQFQRESVVRKVAGVDDDAARATVVGSGTSLLWLVRHLARAETLWFRVRHAGDDVELPDDEVGPGDSLAQAVDAYRAVWRSSDRVVLESPSLDAPCRALDPGDDPANLRWVLAHLLEETARHAGHADILRELMDGSTGR